MPDAGSELAANCMYISLSTVLQRSPHFDRYKSLEEVRAAQAGLIERYPGLFERREIGRSQQGRPIELLSMGSGQRSILLVAGVHANEPVGSLACEVLQNLLAENPDLLNSLDATWHFIDPIDPDGMTLNAGWLAGELSLERYFAHFARPALKHQPDYTFPLEVGPYRFSGSPPENAAFRTALDLCRPDLLCPLHNCEFGGAFFVASESRPELEARWRAVAAGSGIALSEIGEPLSDLPPLSRGVFAMPRPSELIGMAVAKGLDPAKVWPAGGTSADYAASFGSFTFTPEVPLWEAAPSSTRSSCGWSMSAILGELIPDLAHGLVIMNRWQAAAIEPDPDGLLARAVAEQVELQSAQIATLRTYAMQASEEPLSAIDSTAYRVELALFAIRGPAMLRRLIAALPLPDQTEAQGELDDLIGRILARVREVAELTPISPTTLARLQAAAILEAVASRKLDG